MQSNVRIDRFDHELRHRIRFATQAIYKQALAPFLAVGPLVLTLLLEFGGVPVVSLIFGYWSEDIWWHKLAAKSFFVIGCASMLLGVYWFVQSLPTSGMEGGWYGERQRLRDELFDHLRKSSREGTGAETSELGGNESDRSSRESFVGQWIVPICTSVIGGLISLWLGTWLVGP